MGSAWRRGWLIACCCLAVGVAAEEEPVVAEHPGTAPVATAADEAAITPLTLAMRSVLQVEIIPAIDQAPPAQAIDAERVDGDAEADAPSASGGPPLGSAPPSGPAPGHDAPDGPDAPHGQRPIGSAVVVAPGRAITCAHVVGGAPARTIRLHAGPARWVEATVVGIDAATDVAILAFADPDIPALALVPRLPALGTPIHAIGHPQGLGHLITRGVVSAIGRGDLGMLDLEDFIVTDAIVGPGSSGGALIDGAGRLVGMTSAVTRPQGFNGGLALAVPAPLLATVMAQIVEDGAVSRGFIGIRAGPIDADQARVIDVFDGSPADQAGMMPGDVVTALDGQPVMRLHQLVVRCQVARPGGTVLISVRRDDADVTLPVVVGQRALAEESCGFLGFCAHCDCCTF